MVTLGALCLIVLLAGLGWKRGVAQLGAGLVVLLLASFLAGPLAPLTAWLVVALGCPKLFVGTFSILTSGFFVFLVVLIPTTIWVTKRFADDSERPSWDRPLGAVAGGIWGLTLVLFTLTGLSSVARLASTAPCARGRRNPSSARKLAWHSSGGLRPNSVRCAPR